MRAADSGAARSPVACTKSCATDPTLQLWYSPTGGSPIAINVFFLGVTLSKKFPQQIFPVADTTTND
ncbi:hypothetical protein B0T14DRAFT_524618 [Immersiella caudata]|uniref:Uncharacterized protein n=1 Tax=Immersiella caudata TaxID=314043 RepID=A0AA40BXE4_9PEZI|nr:hypothetical protein B0T14DRAFT_524618 [Immersiella caudata]